MDKDYEETTGTLARKSEVSAPTVALYAKHGWLDFKTAANGVRLFPISEVQKVREIYAKRMAKRGRKLA
jgi:DNA-binding transcriptional MerR regulator